MENKEKYIIDRIKDHREEVDIDALWGSISDDIPQPKKKRRSLLWMFFGALALVGIGAFSVFNSPKEKAMAAPSSSLLEKNEANENTIQHLTNIIEEELSKNQLDSEVPSEPVMKTTITDQTAQSKTTDLKLEQIQSDTQLSQSLNNQNGNERKNRKTPLVTSNIFTTLTQLSNEPSESNSESSKRKDVKILSQMPNRLLDIHYLSHSTIEPLDFFSDLSLPITFGTSIVDLEHNSGYTNPWSWHVGTGISHVTRSLTSGVSDLNGERDRRRATEKVQGGWSVNTGLGYKFSPSLTFQVGVGVEQIHELAQFTTNYIATEETTGEVSSTYLQDGTIKVQDGTIVNEIDRRTNEKRYNTLRFYSVPFSANYIIAKNRSFGFVVSALASYSFAQRYEGFVSFDGSQASYDLSEDALGRFRTSGAIAYGSGVSFFKNISSDMRVSAGLDFRRIIGINNPSYLIDQKYNSIRFSVGINHQL